MGFWGLKMSITLPLPICILKLNRDQQSGILEELQGEGNKYFLFDIAGTLIVQREEGHGQNSGTERVL